MPTVIKLPSSEQIDALTGYKSETLVAYFGNTDMITQPAAVKYYGQTVGTSAVQPIDIRKHGRRVLLIENNMDADLDFDVLLFTDVGLGSGDINERLASLGGRRVIPPGERVMLDSKETLGFDLPWSGVVVRTYNTNPTSGSVNIVLLGGTE